MVFKWYQTLLAKRPLITQSATTGILFAVGDCVSQQIIEQKGLLDHDIFRTARMGAYGGLIFGPIVVQWYRFLERAITYPRKPNAEIVCRVAADQLIFTPVNMLFFFAGMSLLEGVDPKQKLEESYWSTLKTNWMVWPVVQLLNFKLIPLNHRLLVVNVVSIGWNSYLSFVNEAAGKPKTNV